MDRRFSRRDFLKLTAGTAAAPLLLLPARSGAAQRNLSIAKWAHFVPEFDAWFETMAQDWGRRHQTKVTVDIIPVEQVHDRASAEVKARKGHDVFMFPWPPAEYHQHAIDHKDVYQAVSRRYGVIDRLAHRSTFYVKARKYFAFADSWIPAPLHYFEDCWAAVDMPMGPVHWNSLRTGGARIREKLGVPCGLALTQSLESNVTLHTLLCSFRSGTVDVAGKVILANARTVAALQYVKDLCRDAGAPETLNWSPGGNVQAMMAHQASCSINAISLLRAVEKQNPGTAKKIRLQPPLLGSNGVVAVPHVTNCSAVWSFSRNREDAQQFLVDLIDSSRTAYEKSLGCNFPFYQKTVPDLIVRLQNDAQGDPPFKYEQLKDALQWTHNLGVPGYATPAAMEVFNTFIVPKMFVSVAKGDLSPEDAARVAAAEVQRIADKWSQA
jgi:multiple sugar transport system substrate-binding protein